MIVRVTMNELRSENRVVRALSLAHAAQLLLNYLRMFTVVTRRRQYSGDKRLADV